MIVTDRTDIGRPCIVLFWDIDEEQHFWDSGFRVYRVLGSGDIIVKEEESNKMWQVPNECVRVPGK